MKTLVVCSGGLDSVTLAYKIAQDPDLDLHTLLSFDYGQRHKKELACAKACADALNAEHLVINISNVGAALTGSALTDDLDVPEGHYAEDNMRVTIVPNRNTIMLSIAYGVAVSKNLEGIAIAVHGGDHFIYPDCRPDFIHAFAHMQNYALEGVADIKLLTPFLTMSKAGITATGQELNVPFEDTWSCYKGGNLHCGRCGTCVERQEAFDHASIDDPTSYEDSDYWQGAVAQAKMKGHG